MRFSIRRLLLFTLVLSVLLGLLVSKIHLSVMSLAISNADLEYDSTNRRWRISGATKIMLEFGESSRPFFVDCLNDPKRYAAAHVALTKMIEFDPGIKFTTDGKLEYLKLEFSHNHIDGLQFTFTESVPLKRYWRNYLTKYDAQGNWTISGHLLFGDLDIDKWKPDPNQ